MLTKERSEISKDNIDDSSAFQFHLQEKLFLDTLYFVGKNSFSDQFKMIIKRYIKVGYNFDVMIQSACLVLNPITVYSYGFLFNCTTVGQTSDSMTAMTLSFNRWVGT